jgi:hypothetical protein
VRELDIQDPVVETMKVDAQTLQYDADTTILQLVNELTMHLFVLLFMAPGAHVVHAEADDTTS